MAKTNVLLIDDKSAARPPSAHATTARSNRAGHPQEAFREFADLPSLLKNNPPQMNQMNHRPTTKLCPPLGASRFILPLLLLGVLNLTTPVQARPTLPAAPTSLTASSGSSSQIDLRWQDNSGNESGFIIQRGPSSSGPWSQIDNVGVNVASYSNTGLNANTTYYYRVYAYNSRGSSGYSGVASATTGQSVSPCTYAISPASASVAAAGGSGTLTVTSASTCSWTPSSSAPAWLTCTPANGTGSGSVTWSVAANSSASVRTATLNIAGQTFTVSQAAASATG